MSNTAFPGRASSSSAARPRPASQDTHHQPQGHSTRSGSNSPTPQSIRSQVSCAQAPLHRLSQTNSSSIRSNGNSQRSAFAAKLRAAGANASSFRHRRDEIINRPEFLWKTFDPADEYYDDPYRSLEIADSINTLECWDYEDTDDVERDQYVRFLEAGDVRQFGPDDNENPAFFNERFEKWLQHEGDFAPLLPSGAGVLRGGLRMALCDRPLMLHGMTIRKTMFEAIEKDFDLHDATLPAFTNNGGCFSIFCQRDRSGDLRKLQVVVKSVQKVEITNCLISLTYDVANRWTDAFACGDGLILESHSDETYGKQQEQLLNACACVGKHMWSNPLLVLVALLQMCSRRALTRTKTLEQRLHGVERALGVVNAGWVVINRHRPHWPMDIDIKGQTRELHSILPQILFVKGVVQWQKRYAAWLLATAGDLSTESTLTDQKYIFGELKATIQLHASSIDGMLEFFESMEGRTQSQMNLLFSVISQVDANINLKIANSTKQDSISMATFTFVTVLFLPGSFIATMFSMGMFDWEAGDSESSSNVLSKRYWIFWVVALPLTLVVLAGWYLWYSHAHRAWQRWLKEEFAERTGMPGRSGDDDDSESEQTDSNDKAEKLRPSHRETRRFKLNRADDYLEELPRKRSKNTAPDRMSRPPSKWMMSRKHTSNEEEEVV